MIYILVFFCILFFLSFTGGSTLVSHHTKVNRSWIFVFLGLLLLIGFRHYSVGTDTMTYIYDFWKDRNLSISQIFQDSFEPLYTLTIMMCHRITTDYTFFLTVFALPISLSFALFLKEHTEDYFISILLFSVLGLMYFSMAGLRQTVGMAFTLVAFRYAYERKLLPFIIYCVIASGFHNSALLFLIVYPMINIKLGCKHWIAVAVAFLLGTTQNGVVMQVVKLFINEDRFGTYTSESYTSSLSLTMFFIQLVFTVFCLLYKNAVLVENPKNLLLYNMAFLGLILQAFTPILGEFFRVSMYFSVSLCVLVPKTIRVIQDRQVKTIAYLGICGSCLAYTFFLPTSYVYSYCLFK